MAAPRPPHPFTRIFLPMALADVSTADTDRLRAPCGGKIVRYQTTLQSGAITGADANVKLQINGVDVTGSAIVVTQSGSAAGDLDEATPTALNTVVEGDLISFVTDGASSTARGLKALLEIEPNA